MSFRSISTWTGKCKRLTIYFPVMVLGVVVELSRHKETKRSLSSEDSQVGTEGCYRQLLGRERGDSRSCRRKGGGFQEELFILVWSHRGASIEFRVRVGGVLPPPARSSAATGGVTANSSIYSVKYLSECSL